MVSLEKVSSNRVSAGFLTKYKFPSKSLNGLTTSFNVFIPDSAKSNKVPVLFYLAGLTCTEDTAAQKGGLFNEAGKQSIALVFPDTSPRGANVQGEDDDWQLGTGAGFYLTATSEKWKAYNMYDLIVKELPEVLKEANLGLDFSRWSITGHSMGGHGALSIYLKNPGFFKSASAFAPVCNPSRTPWGINAFTNYLNVPAPSSENAQPPKEWLEYDSSYLLKNYSGDVNILIDVGKGDDFYKKGQLEPKAISDQNKKGVEVRLHDDFDHSYYFISTFSPEHVAFHAKHLNA
ncbi:S-formylglutathione hydrolase [Kwoniella dendrophila CBS 6074]|uniref:S-formylglutathione hydrolase n=1 Tax=Kwoniella dendrophila CBS 6074 TaxID=1295534 RepID=A0AAX4JLY8_9TREE